MQEEFPRRPDSASSASSASSSEGDGTFVGNRRGPTTPAFVARPPAALLPRQTRQQVVAEGKPPRQQRAVRHYATPNESALARAPHNPIPFDTPLHVVPDDPLAFTRLGGAAAPRARKPHYRVPTLPQGVVSTGSVSSASARHLPVGISYHGGAAQQPAPAPVQQQQQQQQQQEQQQEQAPRAAGQLFSANFGLEYTIEEPRASARVHVTLPQVFVTGVPGVRREQEQQQQEHQQRYQAGGWEHIESEEEEVSTLRAAREAKRKRRAARLERRLAREERRRCEQQDDRGGGGGGGAAAAAAAAAEHGGDWGSLAGARVRLDLPARTPIGGTFVDGGSAAPPAGSRGLFGTVLPAAGSLGRELNLLSRQAKEDAADPAGVYATLPFSPMRAGTAHPPALLDTPGIIAAVRNSQHASGPVPKLGANAAVTGSTVRGMPSLRPPTRWEVIARAVTSHEGYHHLSDRARERVHERARTAMSREASYNERRSRARGARTPLVRQARPAHIRFAAAVGTSTIGIRGRPAQPR